MYVQNLQSTQPHTQLFYPLIHLAKNRQKRDFLQLKNSCGVLSLKSVCTHTNSNIYLLSLSDPSYYRFIESHYYDVRTQFFALIEQHVGNEGSEWMNKCRCGIKRVTWHCAHSKEAVDSKEALSISTYIHTYKELTAGYRWLFCVFTRYLLLILIFLTSEGENKEKSRVCHKKSIFSTTCQCRDTHIIFI